MRWILILLLVFFSVNGFSQWKNYTISARGDTLNRIDMQDRKQGPWMHHYDKIRGEPGYEEEGWYKDDRKEGEWRLFNLVGDLVGIENYKWGFKDGICRYFSKHGELRLEQSWLAMNPDKEYDTIMVEDPDKLDSYSEVIIKNEGADLKHGTWRYFDAATGAVVRTEKYSFGKLVNDGSADAVRAEAADKKAVPKPKEVLEFEKKNAGKKKVKVRDGRTGGG